MHQHTKDRLRSLLIPTLVSLVLGFAMYYGSDASQAFGLAALDTTQVIFSYALGIAEFMTLAVLIRRLVQYVILDGIVARALGTQTPRLLSQIASFIIYLLTVAAIVGVVFKKDLTVLLASAGAAGIVIGMALRELILDVFAGLAINLDRSIKMGDAVLLHRATDNKSLIEGKVGEISWRTTRIHDSFNNLIIIPNSKLAGFTITNYSQPEDSMRIVATVFVKASFHIPQVLRILQAAAIETTILLDDVGINKETSVSVKSLTEHSHNGPVLEYQVRIFATFASRSKATSLLYQTIARHLKIGGLQPSSLKQELLLDHFNAYAKHLPDLIGATELFRDLTIDDLTLLTDSTSLREVKSGVQITLAGEVATIMYLVVEGVFVVEPKFTTSSGKKKPILMSAGSLIGGVALLSGDTYEQTLTSKSPALLCEIERCDVEALLTQKPHLAEPLSLRAAQHFMQGQKLGGMSIAEWQKRETEMATDILSGLKRSFIKTR